MKADLKGDLAGRALWVALGLALVAGIPGRAAAQTNGSASSLGYAFGAPSFVTTTDRYSESVPFLHLGGGGEAILRQGIGIGAELGYVAGYQYFSKGGGLLSVNGSYHLARQARPQPFVTSGYSSTLSGFHVSLWNLGGGADYWMTRRVGLRIEVRDHISFGRFSTAHFWGPRLGVVIRDR